MKRPDTPPGIWKERYESLRRHYVQDRQILGTDPLGLILCLRLGVAGWMRHWATLPAAGSTTAPALAQSLPAPPVITSEWQQQLTVVLAQMTVRHLALTPVL